MSYAKGRNDYANTIFIGENPPSKPLIRYGCPMAVNIYHGGADEPPTDGRHRYHNAIWVTPFLVLHVLLGWL
jgi:hypothetical protein